MGLKVILVNTNRQKVPYPLPPIGVAAVASACARKGHHPKVLDLAFASSPSRLLDSALASWKPDVIGLSIRNADNSDYFRPCFYLEEIKDLVLHIRQSTQAPLVIGGAAVSVMPRELHEFLEPDFAIRGEGEESLVRLLDHQERGTDPEDTPGLVFRRNGNMVINKGRLIENVCSLQSPKIFDWLPVRPYFRYESYYPIQTKRGCSRRCIYCDYPAIEGTTYRTLDPERVADEIEQARSKGIRYFEIVDSTFNIPEHHALAICEALARRRLDICLTGAINPGVASKELFPLMKQAGFHTALCTAESGSDAVLEELRKDFYRDDLIRTASLARRHGFLLTWIFLTGGPGETHQTIDESRSFIRDHLDPKDLVYITNGIRIYPGTGIMDRALEEGIISREDDLLEPVFYFSAALDENRLREQLLAISLDHPNLALSSDLQNRFVPLVSWVLTALRVKRPYGRFAHHMNRMNRLLPGGQKRRHLTSQRSRHN